MALKIVWTPTAKEEFRNIVDYLYESWSLSSAEKFVDTTYKRIDMLSRFPKAGRKSSKLSFVRRLTVSKQTVLFYRVVDDQVILLNFFNTSQDPDTISY